MKSKLKPLSFYAAISKYQISDQEKLNFFGDVGNEHQIVVLEHDLIGTQSINSEAIFLEWGLASLEAILSDGGGLFYILTDSCFLIEQEKNQLHLEIGLAVLEICKKTDGKLSFVNYSEPVTCTYLDLEHELLKKTLETPLPEHDNSKSFESDGIDQLDLNDFSRMKTKENDHTCTEADFFKSLRSEPNKLLSEALKLGFRENQHGRRPTASSFLCEPNYHFQENLFPLH